MTRTQFPLPAGIRRLGVLGGTFDPVHRGHFAIAETAIRAQGLDAVLFIPAAQPVHKRSEPLTPFADRLAMLVLATQGREDFLVSDLEAKRVGPSFTVDTLRQLAQDCSPAVRRYFIIGVDAFVEINTWKNYRELFGLATFLVAGRPPEEIDLVSGTVSRYFPDFHYDKGLQGWLDADEKKPAVIMLNMEPVAVSSTEIRRLVLAGASLTGLVEPAVARYISRHRLYRK